MTIVFSSAGASGAVVGCAAVVGSGGASVGAQAARNALNRTTTKIQDAIFFISFLLSKPRKPTAT
jgi:preprotein translocase subunit SecG